MGAFRRRLGSGLAVLAAASMVAVGCGSSDDTPTTSTTAAGSTETTKASAKAGALEGMKGTTPQVELSADFKAKLDAQGLELKKVYSYGPESYDAAVVIALATLSAASDGIGLAKQINLVTRNGTKCTEFKACADLLKAGTKDIDYDGVSGPMEFSGNGEPTVASFGILPFNASNRIDAAKTTYKKAIAPTEADVAQIPVEGTRAGNGTLKIGTLLPITGSFSSVGPSTVAGVRLAIKEINAAGGVLGKPVESSEGDSSDAQNPTVATQTVDRLLGENVDAIIGAASSSVTLNVIDKVVGAGVAMFSPANTSKKLSTYADKGLYFRDAPSDILQGRVLAEVVAEDNITSLGLLVVNDAYGTGLAEDLTKSFTASGGKVLETIVYDPKAQTFDTEVEKIKAANPAGIVVIGFDESSRILAAMVERGIGPKVKKVYGTDSNMTDKLGEDFEAGK